MAKQSPLDLGKRERELVEILYRLGEASVSQVRACMDDPPSYSAVRAMLNLLAAKELASIRREGKKYLYRPVESKQKVRRSALRRLVQNFFGNQPADAVAALVGGLGGKLSPDDLARIRRLIDEAGGEP